MDNFKYIVSDFIDSFYKKRNINKPKCGRINTFNTCYYVKYVFMVATTGISWNKLNPISINGKSITGNAIYKKYNKWVNDGVFTSLMSKYSTIYIKEFRKVKNLFIDSTDIQNGNNSKHVSFSHKLKGKQTTKLSIICDENKVITHSHVSRSNIHDTKLILPTLNNKICGNKLNDVNLIADKGYICNKSKSFLFKNNKIRLLTGIKKNMKNKKITQTDKKLLKKRIIVEHAFSYLKRSFKRISVIFERKVQNFNSWVYIANAFTIFKLTNKT
jgi:Transposase DDE domain